MPEHFDSLDVDEKLEYLAELRNQMREEGLDPKKDESLFRSLDECEKTIKDSDRWYYRMLRSICGAPRFLITAILALFWS